MRDWRRTRALPLAGMAAAGMVLGHWLAYRFAIPSGHVRADVLTRTGHGYWLLAVKAAVVLGLSGAGAFLVRHLRSSESARSGPVEAYARILVPLAILQMMAFTGTEVLERLAVGAPAASLFEHHLFLLGLAIQFLVACAGGLILLALASGARALAEMLAGGWAQAPRAVSRPLAAFIVPAPILVGSASPRAPPRS